MRTTNRPLAEGLEPLIGKPFPVLDHGFVTVRDYMGNDQSIVNAARISYQKGTRPVNKDAGLINYLISHYHNTPIEQCEIQLHIKLPIFVARQFVRHRTANLNEMSARYSVLDNEFYIPDPAVLAEQSKSNNQGREANELPHEHAETIRNILVEDAARCYQHYEEMLNDPNDDKNYEPSLPSLARELARMNLPINIYTQWVWKIDLHNLLNFVRLRSDSHAQWEIQQYSNIILNEILPAWVPLVYNAFIEYRLEAIQFSQKGKHLLKDLLNPTALAAMPDTPPEGMSARGYREFKQLVENL